MQDTLAPAVNGDPISKKLISATQALACYILRVRTGKIFETFEAGCIVEKV
jgi:hypothetical protein